ncbi:MAG: phospholipase A [Gallionella sp.]|nr:phospholipase A [Gallionella sp.]
MKSLSLSCLLLTIFISQSQAEPLSSCTVRFPSDDAARLKCYDQAPPSSTLLNQDMQDEAAQAAIIKAELARRSYLTRVWNLDDLNNTDDSKLGRLEPYRQNYIMVRETNSLNNQPNTPAPLHATLVANPYQSLETKYLISVKADIGTQRDINLFGFKTLRLWGAYTQQSNWQMFNTKNSSPFRETNYEPELIATFGTARESGLKLVNLGLEHQSNGRPMPESRSWNRLYALTGWEWNNVTSLMGRLWWRVPENIARDDNPDITNYIGHADMVLRWEPADKSQAISLLLRNNLVLSNNRGYGQLDWATPINAGDSSRFHIQLSSGFGETLIDYNHYQTTLGFGFSFREW